MPRATSDEAAIASIELCARQLRLPSVRTEAKTLAAEAERSQQSYLGFLAAILAAEIDLRDERRRSRRVAEARFPRIKQLSAFDLDACPSINPATISMLASASYLDRGEPVVILGDSGTGKSHLLLGLGLAACEQGRSVRYVTCASLANELAEAADERRLSRLVARLAKVELLILDELGYAHLDTRGAELLFSILTEREERSSVAVASNLPFSEWGQVIDDPRLLAAIIDRLTFNATILETGQDSYRLRSTNERRRRAKA